MGANMNIILHFVSSRTSNLDSFRFVAKLLCLWLFSITIAQQAGASTEIGEMTNRDSYLTAIAKNNDEFERFRLQNSEIEAHFPNNLGSNMISHSEERALEKEIAKIDVGNIPDTDIYHVQAGENNQKNERESGKSNKKWKEVREFEIAFQVLNAADALETIYCTRRARCDEGNPIIGMHPSAGRIIAVKALAGVVHYAITRHLFKKRPEWVDEWVVTTTVLQGGVVLWNLQHCF